MQTSAYCETIRYDTKATEWLSCSPIRRYPHSPNREEATELAKMDSVYCFQATE